MLLNYHMGRFVLGSLCVGDLVRLGLKPATRILLDALGPLGLAGYGSVS